ncbi:hypothetical protein [Desulfosarcina sp.]|nr:hypothetical protein [Desulfosarcina sp.]MDX2453260.1 hypothetical protein [Desulfosarcina sp.]MDX2490983.1 hypothetical protein [Desulfosarcina sp.]
MGEASARRITWRSPRGWWVVVDYSFFKPFDIQLLVAAVEDLLGAWKK